MTSQAFPHIGSIRKSINLLYKRLSASTINSFSTSLSAAEAAMPPDREITIAVQLLAGAIARHLQLPKGSIIVSFLDMENPGQVELTDGDDYLVDLHSRYRTDHRDIAAILAHEITHVFLHRHGIRFPDTLDNEILTDTTACYNISVWAGYPSMPIGSLSFNNLQAPSPQSQPIRSVPLI